MLDLDSIPRAEIPALIIALSARLLSEPAPAASTVEASPTLLTVEDAATRLGVERQWLYRRAKKLGLAVTLSPGTLRISSTALDAFIRGRTASVVPGRRKRALDGACTSSRIAVQCES
jgi:hypothetical protein